MKNMSILYEAQSYYNKFFKDEAWDENGANHILKGKSDLKNRKIVVKFCYKMIFDNRKLNDAVKDWVKTGLSLEQVANLHGISIYQMKNMQNYAARTYKKDLSLGDEDYIHLMVYKEEISKEEWKQIDTQIKQVRLKRGKEIGERKPLIQNKDILINIPARQFKESLENQAEWNAFIQLIKPYFISERKRVQELVNTEYADQAAYLNYIITPGVKLTEDDKKRYKELKKLLGEDNEIIKSADNTKREDKINTETTEQNSLANMLADMTEEEWEKHKKTLSEKSRKGILTDEEWQAYIAERKKRDN